MNQIEHDPNEPKIDRTPFKWWPAWLVVALIWFGEWYYGYFDWGQIILGLGTGVMLTAWAIETTGNKVPESWRRKPPRNS